MRSPRRSGAVIAIAAAVALASSPGTAAAGAGRLPSRPGRPGWHRIQSAAHLRALALERHRTAHFRAYSASLGLAQLALLRPLAHGRCATAVRDLHNNLLDLENAYPGENWAPLRRLVATEPSIRACAPR